MVAVFLPGAQFTKKVHRNYDGSENVTKSEYAFFQTLSCLSRPAYFVECDCMQVQKIKENSPSCFHVLHFKFHILGAQWTSKKCKSKEVARGVTTTKTLEN